MFARTTSDCYDYTRNDTCYTSLTGFTNETTNYPRQNERQCIYYINFGKHKGKYVSSGKMNAMLFNWWKSFISRLSAVHLWTHAWDPIFPTKCVVTDKFPGHLRKVHQHRHRGSIGSKNFCKWSN